MRNVAVCPGSFDPVTAGHVDIIERAIKMHDQVVVGVAVTPPKKPLFSLEERVGFLEKTFEKHPEVTVDSFDGLAVEFARRHKAQAIIRGLRAVSDFEHEFQMAQLNRRLDSTIETIFVMANTKYAYLSSSAVKEIDQYDGNIEGLVPSEVEKSLKKVFLKRGE